MDNKPATVMWLPKGGRFPWHVHCPTETDAANCLKELFERRFEAEAYSDGEAQELLGCVVEEPDGGWMWWCYVNGEIHQGDNREEMRPEFLS